MYEVKEYLERYKKELHKDILFNKRNKIKIPHLVIIKNNDVHSFFDNLIKDCEEIGIQYTVLNIGDTANNKKIYKILQKLNKDKKIDGIVIQPNISPKIDDMKVVDYITVDKELSGISNSSKYDNYFIDGIFHYLKDQCIVLDNKNILFIGDDESARETVFHKSILSNSNISCVNSRIDETNLKHFIAKSDIIISSVGINKILKKSYGYKKTAYVFDAWPNISNADYSGDCDKCLSVAYQTEPIIDIEILGRISILKKLFNK